MEAAASLAKARALIVSHKNAGLRVRDTDSTLPVEALQILQLCIAPLDLQRHSSVSDPDDGGSSDGLAVTGVACTRQKLPCPLADKTRRIIAVVGGARGTQVTGKTMSRLGISTCNTMLRDTGAYAA